MLQAKSAIYLVNDMELTLTREKDRVELRLFTYLIWIGILPFGCSDKCICLSAEKICNAAWGNSWDEKSETCQSFRTDLIDVIRLFMNGKEN